MLPLQPPRSHAPANPMNKASAWRTPKRPNHPPRLYLSADHGNPDSTPTEPALGDVLSFQTAQQILRRAEVFMAAAARLEQGDLPLALPARALTAGELEAVGDLSFRD